MTPITDIFIVSFRRDVEFTNYCLRSIAKFAEGFHRVVLLVPKTDADLFTNDCLKPELIRLFNDDDKPSLYLKTFDQVPDKGMLHHEAMICSADMFCNADYILHMDADCVFKEPVTPDDYFVNGKPVLLKESFDRLEANCRFWQQAVEKALGFKPQYETMRRHPAVHPRWLYAKVREAVEKHTGKPFVDYVLSCQNHFPQGFAEFPTLGAWALQYAPDAHHWIDRDTQPEPPHKLRQFWTHGGVDMVWKPDGGKRVRQILEEILR